MTLQLCDQLDLERCPLPRPLRFAGSSSGINQTYLSEINESSFCCQILFALNCAPEMTDCCCRVCPLVRPMPGHSVLPWNSFAPVQHFSMETRSAYRLSTIICRRGGAFTSMEHVADHLPVLQQICKNSCVTVFRVAGSEYQRHLPPTHHRPQLFQLLSPLGRFQFCPIPPSKV